MRSVTGMFYVKDFDHDHPEEEKLVPAKFLLGLDGEPVPNPNHTLNVINKLDNHYFNADGTEIHDANPHNYLVVPVNYSIFRATDFVHLINRAEETGFFSAELMVKAFLPGGGEDLQRTYQNADGSTTHGGKFVPMFQDAASFHLGIVAQLSGYGANLAENAGSVVEFFSKSPDLWSSMQSSLWSNDTLDKSVDKLFKKFGQDVENNERNRHSITEGAAYIQSHIHEIANPLPPMEPVGNNAQPVISNGVERPFHESSLLETARQTGKHHLGEHLEVTAPEQAGMQTDPVAFKPAEKENFEAGSMGMTQGLQQENRPDVLDRTIIALLPAEARPEFQGFSFVPEPENQNTVRADAIVGVLGVGVDNEVNVAAPIANQIINDETLADGYMPSHDSNGYDSDGYDCDGYDSDGYNCDGYDCDGYDCDGYDCDGYDCDGYDCNGYDSDGYDCDGYDSDGYDCDGYDCDGYDCDGYDCNGYDSDGYDCDGYDSDGYDSSGYDSDGYDSSGYDSSGYDSNSN